MSFAPRYNRSLIARSRDIQGGREISLSLVVLGTGRLMKIGPVSRVSTASAGKYRGPFHYITSSEISGFVLVDDTGTGFPLTRCVSSVKLSLGAGAREEDLDEISHEVGAKSIPQLPFLLCAASTWTATDAAHWHDHGPVGLLTVLPLRQFEVNTRVPMCRSPVMPPTRQVGRPRARGRTGS